MRKIPILNNILLDCLIKFIRVYFGNSGNNPETVLYKYCV